jgi:hypothetical protein
MIYSFGFGFGHHDHHRDSDPTGWTEHGQHLFCDDVAFFSASSSSFLVDDTGRGVLF